MAVKVPDKAVAGGLQIELVELCYGCSNSFSRNCWCQLAASGGRISGDSRVFVMEHGRAAVRSSRPGERRQGAEQKACRKRGRV